MSHLPVNHPLRPLYRLLAALCGLYVLLFGIIAFTQTAGLDTFAQDGLPWVLGLKANRAFALLSIVAGIVLVGAAVIGRNVAHYVHLAGAVVFLVAGMAMMTLLRTDLNFLGFTMSTCIMSFVIGLLLGLAGLYGQVGTREQRDREEAFRHGAGPDPESHVLGAENVPRSQEA
ncbi:DUF4383 domain-containing protein [Luedemannella helvata]|uniref:DUF4383 domain-containing protein n=1 Tax=Luedemannella helvata TaxID=349315 RepID=A0ABN2K518_9ACTN